MKILFSNFLSYDWIIFALAVVNIVIFFLAWKKAHSLYESVAPRINISSGNAERAFAQAQENSTYFSLYEKWQKAEFFYTLFCNLTGVFTLLGILGTVISLLHLVDSSADLTGEFMGALTSTLWGIVFTILFKVIDSAISFDLEMGERITELIQMREYESVHKKAEEDAKKTPAERAVEELEDPWPWEEEPEKILEEVKGKKAPEKVSEDRKNPKEKRAAGKKDTDKEGTDKAAEEDTSEADGDEEA